MKALTPLFIAASFALSANAGPVPDDYAKSGKAPIVPTAPPTCDCFAPGFALGVFGGTEIPSHGGNEGWGGGVLAEYFFSEYCGIQLNYGAFSTSPVHHSYGADLVLRYPIKSLCIAPYIMAGGGGVVNGTNRGTWDVGGGIEARFKEAGCMSVFLDGSYHFSGEKRDNDYTMVRLGVKFPF